MDSGVSKIAVFASGNGSNFEAIVKASLSGELVARVALCVTDRPEAGVTARARRLGVPVLAVSPQDFVDKDSFESYIVECLKPYDLSLICLAGYMRIIGRVLLQSYKNRIINLHPSLLPSFKGAHAIRDAFLYGVKVFGVTVHLVDENLDSGPIIAQEAFSYYGDDLTELEEKIHALEHRLYPSVINNIVCRLRECPDAGGKWI